MMHLNRWRKKSNKLKLLRAIIQTNSIIKHLRCHLEIAGIILTSI
jgi:hypothetical protein